MKIVKNCEEEKLKVTVANVKQGDVFKYKGGNNPMMKSGPLGTAIIDLASGEIFSGGSYNPSAEVELLPKARLVLE